MRFFDAKEHFICVYDAGQSGNLTGGNSNTKFVLGFCGGKLTLFKISPKHQHTLQPAALTFREGIWKYACLICTETV